MTVTVYLVLLFNLTVPPLELIVVPSTLTLETSEPKVNVNVGLALVVTLIVALPVLVVRSFPLTVALPEVTVIASNS